MSDLASSMMLSACQVEESCEECAGPPLGRGEPLEEPGCTGGEPPPEPGDAESLWESRWDGW